jgi:hypothetical protein
MLAVDTDTDTDTDAALLAILSRDHRLAGALAVDDVPTPRNERS